MSISLIILSIVIFIIMFGMADRFLDKMRMNDITALILCICIVIGIIIPPIYITEYFSFSIGGFLIPFGICVYLLIKCGWSRDLVRSIIGTILVAGIVIGLEYLLPAEPEKMVIEPAFIYGIITGIIAYIMGRSRRNAFISAVFGITLAEIIQWIINWSTGIKTVLGLGNAGAFDMIIVSALIALALCEFIGRVYTRIKPDTEDKKYNFVTGTYDSEKNGKLSKSEKTMLKANVVRYEKSSDKNNGRGENKNNDGEKHGANKNNGGEKSGRADTVVDDKKRGENKNNDGEKRGANKNNDDGRGKNKNNDGEKHGANKNNDGGRGENKNHDGGRGKAVNALIIMVAFSLCLSLLFVNFSAVNVYAFDNENKYYTIYDGNNSGKVLFVRGESVNNGDEYISSLNELYELYDVDNTNKTAKAKFKANVKMPVFNIKRNNTQRVNASSKTVGMYHTHNDECYLPTDGVDSVYGKGGITDVGKTFMANLEKLGISVKYSDTLHLPHNSGAYGRSEVTASKLIRENKLNAIFDVHRDSTPRSEYITTVGGEKMSKVRMVVGAANQNSSINKEFALTIKSYADEIYPGLIKDIYIGKGNYNQQLSPRAMLFEMGCENIEKALVQKSTVPLSKTLDVVIFGSNAASGSSLMDVSSKNGDELQVSGLVEQSSVAPLDTLWVVLGAIGAVLIIFGIVLIFDRDFRYKTSRFFHELFPFKKKIQE